MSRLRILLWSLWMVSLASGCNFPGRLPATPAEDAVLILTPVPSKTSPFVPLITLAPTPAEEPGSAPLQPEGPQITPTAGLLPGLRSSALEIGSAVNVTAFDMLDLKTGWAEQAALEDGVSGNFLRTQDGGATWQDVTPPAGYPQGSRFFALDSERAWVIPAVMPPEKGVEFGYVWRTVDGGATWQASFPIQLQLQEVNLLEYFLPQAVYFLDETHGWLVVSVGHYMNQDVLVILATEDGGLTWQPRADKFSMGGGEGQDGGAGMPCKVNGIAFLNPQTGFLAGDCLAVSLDEGFSIRVTHDGGRTWQLQALPEPLELPQEVRSAAPGNDRFCAATGVENTPAGILVQHTCQVLEGSGMLKNYFFLSLLPQGSNAWLGWAGESASFANSTEGICLGQLLQNGTRSLRATKDGGKTWQPVDIVYWSEARLDFPDPLRGFALARQWNTERQAYDYALVRTENGGRRWSLVGGVAK